MDVFICYETTTGLSYARNVKEALRKDIFSAFVADEDVPKGTQGRNVIDEAIGDCRYFVVIMTLLAIRSSDEVKREIELASKLNKIIIPCKPRIVDRLFTSMLPVVGGVQQVDFDTKEDLADQIVTLIIKREQEKIIGRTSIAEAARTELSNIQPAMIVLKDYEFGDGSKAQRLFVVLTVADIKSPCLVLKTTSQSKRYEGVTKGCNPDKGVFFVPTSRQSCFLYDTYIQLPQIFEISTEELLQGASSKRIRMIDSLSADCFAQLKNCLKQFREEISPQHWTLIYSPT